MCSHRTWWINRSVLSKPTFGWFFSSVDSPDRSSHPDVRLHPTSSAGCTGYFLRKSPEIDDIARKMHFHSLLCLVKASCLGHLFIKAAISNGCTGERWYDGHHQRIFRERIVKVASPRIIHHREWQYHPISTYPVRQTVHLHRFLLKYLRSHVQLSPE